MGGWHAMPEVKLQGEKGIEKYLKINKFEGTGHKKTISFIFYPKCGNFANVGPDRVNLRFSIRLHTTLIAKEQNIFQKLVGNYYLVPFSVICYRELTMISFLTTYIKLQTDSDNNNGASTF